MINNKFQLGILVTVLVFGVMAFGCDDSSTNYDDDQKLPAAYGLNAVGGKTYFGNADRIVFSTTSKGDLNRTYTVISVVFDENFEIVFVDDKMKYADTEAGIYTWNEDVKTVTLKPEKVAFYGEDGLIGIPSVPLDKTAYRSRVQAYYKTRQNMDEAAINQALSFMVNSAFSNKTKNYSFSTDGTVLFLEEPLPANEGKNELSGQTYNGTTWDSDQKKRVKDTSKVYVFTAFSYTLTEPRYGGTWRTTGTYAYDSSQKRVWLKPLSIDGLNRAAYYDAAYRFTDDDIASRAANTAFEFMHWLQVYNITNKTIGF